MPQPKTPSSTTAANILDLHDLFLIDAYGVLMTSSGPLPGAAEFLEILKTRGKDYFIVTNDASRTPETCVRVYRDRGFTIPVEKVLSAGVAIIETFRTSRLQGSRTVVLGTSETEKCVKRAGGLVQDITDDVEYDVLVIGDDSGYDFLETMNALLTATHRLIKRGRCPRFLLANPDLLYPRTKDSFGFTSGSVARFLEIGLRDLHPDVPFTFEVLGKPAPLLFNHALSLTNIARERTVMLGDQLPTDIAGANSAGIQSALLATGITQFPLPPALPAHLTPTYLLQSLEL